MCLIALALAQHPDYVLVLAGNRDEFYARPTAPLAWWDDAPDLLAGRDLQGGGTWLGINRSGRLAALTNIRAPHEMKTNAPSRGALTAGFLLGQATVPAYLQPLLSSADQYNGYNLLLGEARALSVLHSRTRTVTPLASGWHTLSNAALNTPWPKTTRLLRALQTTLASARQGDESLVHQLLQALGDSQPAPDEQLPETGIGLEWERRLSPVYIQSENYGTRSSTVLLVRPDGRVIMVEQTYRPAPEQRWMEFTLAPGQPD